MSEDRIRELLDASSLGTPAAKKLIARTPPGAAARAVQRAKELENESMTSTSYNIPTQEILGKRLRERDKPGEHLWIIPAVWACLDPESTGTVFLDAENLIGFSGPGCFKCEQVYSRKLAKRPCQGSVDEVQP